MRKVNLMLFVFFALNSLSAQNWNEVEVGTNENLSKVYFVNDDLGFITGDKGNLLKTNNGGDSWELMDVGVTHNLKTISFANEEVGFINGLMTTDGGTTWVPQASSAFYGFLYAYSENRIMAGHGDNFDGIVYESTDLGASWETTFSFMELTMFNDCYFVSENEGYLVSWYAGYLFKTVDAGITWNEIMIEEVDGYPWGSDDYRSVSFPSSEIGLVTHQNGILKTVDSGETWSDIRPGGVNFSLYPESVIALSTEHYIMVGRGSGIGEELEKIVETTDGGASWVEAVPTIENMYDVACNAKYCFAVGSNGMVYRKENVTNSILETLEVDFISIYPNPAQDILQIDCVNEITGIQLFNVHGKLLHSFTTNQKAIDIAHLNSGTYFLRVSCKDIIIPTKFVKM